MERFLAALSFLTTIPIKKNGAQAKDLRRSLAFFPIVGALIGIALALILKITYNFPDLLIGVILLGASILLTGGLHLDGFADTCDGFWGSRSKEEILEIMRDSRVGVMGVTGITLLLLFKFSLIVSIPRALLGKTLILSAIFSRWAQAYACLTSKYAREAGKAKSFIGQAKRGDIIAGGIFTVASFLISSGIPGFIILTFSSLVTALFIRKIRRRIGGMTGDTIGAVNEVAEGSVLFFALLLTIH